jgi:hypothetical protein
MTYPPAYQAGRFALPRVSMQHQTESAFSGAFHAKESTALMSEHNPVPDAK